MALLQESLVFTAHHKAHVGHRMDKAVGRTDQPLAQQVRPELAGEVKFNIDLQCCGDIYRAVLTHRREVQLTVARMARASVVPRTGTLLGFLGHPLDHLDRQIRLQLFEEHAKRCAHDAGSNQEHINRFAGHACTSAVKRTSAPGANTT